MNLDMFCGKTLFSNKVKVVVIIAFLIFSINPLEAATRPNMKSKLGTIKVSIPPPQDRAKVPPSTTNPPTYIPGPGPGNGGGHK
ncbi:hypothetical protein FCV25MIE_22772 [Fagus crenata]|uniref:Uncharacterized protein n=1 Tax=Fagus sylvatica TaxID=28930 RepID=A0A2N9H508_FAGSY